MKAIVYEKYGSPDVLQLREVPTPTPTDDHVLVKVRATSPNPYDWHFIRGEPYVMRLQSGLTRPKLTIVGADLAGQVEEVGRNVTGMHSGDEVFGVIAGNPQGSFAEYISVPADSLVNKPLNLSFEQAAVVPLAGLTALQGLREIGNIKVGQKVLIIGASGGVGTFAVQLARHFGAEVTGVCSTRNVELVRSLGAHHVIDYTQSDFTKQGQQYDLTFQVAGTTSASACRRALTPKGTLVLCSGDGGGPWLGPLGRLVVAMAQAPFVSQKIVTWVTRRSQEGLLLLKELIESETIRPIIDREYALSETAEAIAYLEKGHARGKIVITV